MDSLHPKVSDDALVARLRADAPSTPAVWFDGPGVTARVRRSLRRRRFRNVSLSVAGAAVVYLALALAGPLPGLGTAALPGGEGLRSAVRDAGFGGPPGPDQWPDDVARLEADVMPVVDDLEVTRYLYEPGSPGCRILVYERGDFSDARDCEEMTPFDTLALADFDGLTAAIERSGVAVERINRQPGDADAKEPPASSGLPPGSVWVPLHDDWWPQTIEYNWEYVYLPGADEPPATMWPGETWTRIDGDWWFHRAHDD